MVKPIKIEPRAELYKIIIELLTFSHNIVIFLSQNPFDLQLAKLVINLVIQSFNLELIRLVPNSFLAFEFYASLSIRND